ncbi:MAG: polymer-forming cytoskeletal protein [Pseudomonadales bacterium]|nr:polymer-forming cytoskeletal protein [Pseudomonadales bacterium]NRA14419.1 polymer-forming cytoskeletal protein [Oceanospirillaceae bacterium]
MGFFKKSVPSESKRTALTIIAKGNKISGEMSFTGKLHIDGCVEGNITSVENVSIGKSGKVNGVIRAKNITVCGLLEGEVYCQQLHIAAGGRVVANIVSVELTMDSKSQFIGERRESGADNLLAETIVIDKPKLDIIGDLPDKITLIPELKSNKKANKKAAAIEAKKLQTEPVQSKKISSLSEKINKKTKVKSASVVSEATVLKESKPQPAKNQTAVVHKPQQSRDKQQVNHSVSAVEQDKHSADEISRQTKVKVVDENTTLLELKF